MNTDKLMVWVGLAPTEGIPISGEPTEGDASALCDGAEAYLRASGMVTPELWGSLSELSRAAFVAAGNLIRKEHAADIGMATRSDIAAMALTDPEGAFDALATSVLDAGVKRMAAKASEGGS
jgi:hypothetical protein